jgi:FMN phosphatase YigB (HAD superfamily)
VIYFGDHLFSDLRGPSKAGWHTVAIIHELEVCILLDFSQIVHIDFFIGSNLKSIRLTQSRKLVDLIAQL